VFRWSLLGLGVLYGAVHRNTLAKQAEHKRLRDEYAHKQALIAEARAEYAKLKNPSGPRISHFAVGRFSDAPGEIDWNDPKSIEDAIKRL